MNKYVLIYNSTPEAWESMNNKSEEDQKKGMELWMAWKDKCGDGMVDFGAPLSGGKKVSKDGISDVSSTVTGYTVLQAENMEAALEMVKGHPHFDWADGCDIDVYEAKSMNM